MAVASADMTVWDWVLASVGIGLIGVLLVMGAVAWVRDVRAERISRRGVTELVDQVKNGMAEQGGEWTLRQP